MSAVIDLKDIVDALEMQFDESLSFLDLGSGQVETVSKDLLGAAEEGELPDVPAWQEREWDVARRIASTDRYLGLPTKFEVHEWAIMEKFTESLESQRIRENLRNALRGARSFRRFKDALSQYGIETDWYAFRTEALRQIAADWCEEHGIARR